MVAVAGVVDKHSESQSEACFDWKHLTKKKNDTGLDCYRCRRRPALIFLVADLKTNAHSCGALIHCCFDVVRKNPSFPHRSVRHHRDGF